MDIEALIEIGYIVASVLFIIGIKMLGRPERARRGNMVSALGMLVAVVSALFECCLSFSLVIAGMVVGAFIGVIAARTVKMTSMPQMVAILNGFGGLASLLVGWENYHSAPEANLFIIVAILLAVLIGGVAFSGSVVAYRSFSAANKSLTQSLWQPSWCAGVSSHITRRHPFLMRSSWSSSVWH